MGGNRTHSKRTTPNKVTEEEKELELYKNRNNRHLTEELAHILIEILHFTNRTNEQRTTRQRK